MSILMFHEISANKYYINKLIKKIIPNENLVYKNYSFINAFARSIYISQESDLNSFNLYDDIKKNKLKKKYSLKSYYFYILIKILYSSKIKNIKIKLNFIKKHFTKLNIFTKCFFKIYICWASSDKLSISTDNKKKNIFLNFKNNFSKKIYEKHISKHFKDYKIVSMSMSNSLFERLLIFFRNLRICWFNSYPTKNYHVLVLYMKYDIIDYLIKDIDIEKGLFFEGDGPDDDLISGYLRKKKTKTYLFQQGSYFNKQIPIYLRDLNYDYFFCWGDFYKYKIKKYSPSLKIFSIGRIGRNYKTTIKKKIIVFANQNNPSTGAMFYTANKFYELCKWCLENLKDYKIIVKPHPKYNVDSKTLSLKKYKKFVLAKQSNDIIDYLHDAQFLIAVSSTALIDALSYRVLPISFMSNSNIQPDLKKHKLGIIVNTLNEAKKTLIINTQNKILFKEKLNNNKSQYYIKDNFDQNLRQMIKKKII
jgi:hypothetical protein